MTSEQVAEHQRSRILRAMIDAVGDLGYTDVTVAEVIGRASVSRATFYEQFTDKRQCFLTAYEVSTTILLDDSDVVGARTLPALLRAFFDALCGNPALARVFTVEINTLGMEGMIIRRAVQARFADVIAEIVLAGPERRFACDAFVASISMLVSIAVAGGETAGVRALCEPLIEVADRLFA